MWVRRPLHSVEGSYDMSIGTSARGIPVLCAVWWVVGCSKPAAKPNAHGSASARLKPFSGDLPNSCVTRTVYVPIYSSLSRGSNTGQRVIDLGAVVSVRNVSGQHPLVLT